jgi:glycosyltransferase involved in cell wall biosynthesis
MKNVQDYKISIIIPAYNEEASISEVIHRIQKVNKDWQVLVVDDGSSDQTAQMAKASGAEVIKHPYNIGLGGSLKSAARIAKGDIFVFVDGDGQHPAEEIPKLLDLLKTYHMVVGIRPLSQQAPHRAWGNRIFIWVAERLSGHKIPDLTSGFRAMHREYFMEFIHLLPNRYSSSTTLTLAMLKAGLFVGFTSVSGVKIRRAGKSGIAPMRDGFRIVGLIFRTIMLFNPQIFFLPISAGIFSAGVLMGVFQLLRLGGIKGITIIFILTGILIFMFGLLADQIANIRLGAQKPQTER